MEARATYTTLDGDVLDLCGLTSEEREFLATMYRRYTDKEPWLQFREDITGATNPALRASGRVTRAAQEHPLYRAVRDLADRLGIHSNELLPEPGDDVGRDPFDDTFIPVAQAASRQRVSLKAVYKAIERGELVAVRAGRTMVSVNSLRRWAVNPVRQAAGASRRTA